MEGSPLVAAVVVVVVAAAVAAVRVVAVAVAVAVQWARLPMRFLRLSTSQGTTATATHSTPSIDCAK